MSECHRLNSAQDKHSRRCRGQNCHRARSHPACNNLFIGSDSLVPFCLRCVSPTARIADCCSFNIGLHLSCWSCFQCTCLWLTYCYYIAIIAALSCLSSPKEPCLGMKESLWIRKDRACNGKLWFLVDSHWLPDLKVKDPILAPQRSTANWLNKHASLGSSSDMNLDASWQV